jgi:peptidoglycan-associated lipoprotein
MKKFAFAVSLVVLAFGATACATKKYVNSSVGEVNEKVSALSKSVEETQERTRQNEQKIQQVDEKYGKQVAAVVEKASKKLVYEVTISEASGNFKFGSAQLPEAAKAQIDQLIERLKADPNKGGYIEIEGHTDNVGDEAYNEQLGLQRAEMVKEYLYEKHGIPLHRMNVFSYGERKPAAPNTTAEGRAENRRVVIRVLS